MITILLTIKKRRANNEPNRDFKVFGGAKNDPDNYGFDCTLHRNQAGRKVNVDVIDGWHKERGFKKQPQSGRICGYHFVVLPDGTIETGRYLSEIGAHVSGQNSRSIGICYVGGLDANGKASDTRTPEQKEALLWLLMRLVVMFPDATIKGHRDYSPDLNGDGIIEPWEYIKECPCFNAAIEYNNV